MNIYLSEKWPKQQHFFPISDFSSNQNQKPIDKKLWLPELFFGSLFFFKKQQIFDFLAGNNYPDWPNWQGGMKFATQISPLLDYCVNDNV